MEQPALTGWARVRELQRHLLDLDKRKTALREELKALEEAFEKTCDELAALGGLDECPDTLRDGET